MCARHARLHSPRSSGTTPRRGRSTGLPLPRLLNSMFIRPLPSFLVSSFVVLSHGRSYTSIDPAPPTSGLLAGKAAPEDASEENIAKLQNTLNDTNLPLFDRYRAMFALRNIGTPAAVDALASGFADDSALFKHVSLVVFMLVTQANRRGLGTRLRLCSASSSLPIPSLLFSRCSRIPMNPRWFATRLPRPLVALRHPRFFLTSRSG